VGRRGRIDCVARTNEYRSSFSGASEVSEELPTSGPGRPGSIDPTHAGPETDYTTTRRQRSSTFTILVVDDEEALRRVVQRQLSKHGFRVVTASDGMEALHIATSVRDTVDLVITDVMMPNMNGGELAGELVTVCPNAKILFMSGFPGSLLDEREAASVLAKPFSEAELIQHIQRVLGEGGAH
jgi:CheY-like chemotaxis protein